MDGQPLRLELSCPACSHAEIGDRDRVIAWLLKQGMLRRNPDATDDELRELLRVVAPRMTCPQCSHAGLRSGPPAEDTVDWLEARRCQACGDLIDPDRLEVFPDTIHCTRCQRALDTGTLPEEPEYCPRCGALMELRPTRTGGITRYRLVCTANPRCGR